MDILGHISSGRDSAFSDAVSEIQGPLRSDDPFGPGTNASHIAAQADALIAKREKNRANVAELSAIHAKNKHARRG